MKFSNALLLALAMTTAIGHAAEDDFRQPVSVTADRSEGDLQSRTLSYLDNVVVVQGTLKIHADKLTLQSNEAQTEQIFVATGNPATYEQMMDNGLMAEAEASEIRYSVAKRELILTGEAELRQDGSLVKGDRISYNALEQKLTAKGSKQEQITTIFLPKTEDEAPKTEPTP
ncbi:lipopolysaccharide transport periplasmic protein LptA [Ferrimonas senticii]|uniref:lipopolysaccharide transport periplasmic protein LptA n=1 Tax=Ferrimonas senticii TaxID=394566 RepID=UPI00040969F3|nr:lipopolysaccharide transport periplasmic protein LptA [Ferrimonas senticii]